MQLLSVVFFAITVNLDSFIIGMSYGIKGIKIKCRSNFIISTVIFVGTFISMLLGKGISFIIPPNIACTLGGILIVFIGIYCFISYIVKDSDLINEKADLSCSSAIVLGCFLAINNIGLGIGGSMSGLSPFITPTACFAINWILIFWGNAFGSSAISNNIFNKYAEPISAIIIIVLGIYEIIM